MRNLFCVGREYLINQIWLLQRVKGNLEPTLRD